ncbi:MAG TPA: hypothetical protein VJB59_01145 [Bdellovibrionota bacterium]|nr:hypothetical protein [Bdellovibrionota bacterium]
MKILLLNPHLDAEHNVLKMLQARGMALLIPENAQDALQMAKLHGQSIDLAIIHRESGDRSQLPDVGTKFLAQLKLDPIQSDLPVILTSEGWGDAEFAAHQRTPLGANAYLKWPFTGEELLATIDMMFGSSIETGSASLGGTIPSYSAAPTLDTCVDGTANVALEEASDLFQKPAKTDSSIKLEAPEGASEPKSPEIPQQEPTSLDAPPLADFLDLAPLADPSLKPVLDFTAVEADTPPPAPSSPLELAAAPPSSEPEFKPEPEIEAVDTQAASEMPYLFSEVNEAARETRNPLAVNMLYPPVGDAIVPGGAAQSPDVETLKKYLLLREQDVSTLSSKLKAALEQVSSVEKQLQEERTRNVELTHLSNEQKHKIDEFEKDKKLAVEGLQNELNELRFELKSKVDKARLLESRIREAASETERLKERVRSDIRKIRVREKELENRLEISRKDSEVLISARENKIIELKRKLDLLEFNMDLLQDQYTREKENSAKLRERLVKAAQVVRVAGGVLDSPAEAGSDAGSQGEEKPEPTIAAEKSREAS